MAFYYNSTTNAFYDTDIFPVADLPANSVLVAENTYKNLMTNQNNGGFIAHDNSGNPLVGYWISTAATDMVHSGKIADANTLGHVMSGSVISVGSNGKMDLVNGSIFANKIAGSAVTTVKIADEAVTTAKIADEAVTTAKIAAGAVTEDKLDSVKDLEADETSLTLTEGADAFTMSIKAGGVGETELAANAVSTAKIVDEAVTTQKIDDGAVTTVKIGNGAVTKDKLASSVIPSVLSFNVHYGTRHWYPSDNYFIIADLPADAGMIFDFTFRYDTEVANASPGDLWCVDLVVKTGLTYNNAVENARHRIFFKNGDRQSIRFTFNGLGSGNIYLAAERQIYHPSWDPADFSINEVYLSGIKIFGN